MGGDLLEDVFSVLGVATKLEQNEDTRIEAATKVRHISLIFLRQLSRWVPVLV